jgi:two-component system, response regulator
MSLDKLSIPRRTEVPILVAEDDPDDRLILREAFAAAGIVNPLRFVEDGEQLLEYLDGTGAYADRASHPLPGLIVLDLNMPRIDGREAVARIRRRPEWSDVPVVVLTTSRAVDDQRQGWQSGIDAYFCKSGSFARMIEIAAQIRAQWFSAGIALLPPRGWLE